jgi:RHS repeat-associated protein
MTSDDSSQLLRRYVYGAGIDEPVCLITAAGAKYYDSFDGIGSVIALTDETGAEVETAAYGPFGEGGFSSAVGNPYGFTGRRFDPETGLYYYRARYYDPELGRFLQVEKCLRMLKLALQLSMILRGHL